MPFGQKIIPPITLVLGKIITKFEQYERRVKSQAIFVSALHGIATLTFNLKIVVLFNRMLIKFCTKIMMVMMKDIPYIYVFPFMSYTHYCFEPVNASWP